MGQFAETHFAEFGKVSLPCPFCRIFFRASEFGKVGIEIQQSGKSSCLHLQKQTFCERKYNVGHIRCMHARPHRRKDQLPLRSLRDLRSR